MVRNYAGPIDEPLLHVDPAHPDTVENDVTQLRARAEVRGELGTNLLVAPKPEVGEPIDADQLLGIALDRQRFSPRSVRAPKPGIATLAPEAVLREGA